MQIDRLIQIVFLLLRRENITAKQPPAYKEEYNTPVFVLHFSEKIAYKVYDEFQEKYIKKIDDGTLEVTFRYQFSDWTFLYLLSFGEYVEIIEPIEARNILKEKAKRISAMY